jgi:hypothetical protein
VLRRFAGSRPSRPRTTAPWSTDGTPSADPRKPRGEFIVVFALAITAALDRVPPSLITEITGLRLWRKWSMTLAPSLGNSPSPQPTVGDDRLRGSCRAEQGSSRFLRPPSACQATRNVAVASASFAVLCSRSQLGNTDEDVPLTPLITRSSRRQICQARGQAAWRF